VTMHLQQTYDSNTRRFIPLATNQGSLNQSSQNNICPTQAHRLKQLELLPPTQEDETNQATKPRRALSGLWRKTSHPSHLREPVRHPLRLVSNAAAPQTKVVTNTLTNAAPPFARRLKRAKPNLKAIANDLKQRMKLPPGLPAETAARAIAYGLLIHPLYTSRIQSIAKAAPLPELSAMSYKAVVPCVLRTAVEYALAVGLSQKINHHFLRLQQHAPWISNQGTSGQLMGITKNALAAVPTASMALSTERINQKLILGHTLSGGIQAIMGPSRHVGEFFRGLPIASLGLMIYLTIRENAKNRSTKDPEGAKLWAAGNMALIGSLGGIVDYSIGLAQLKGMPSLEAIQQTLTANPSTLIGYGLLGALSLGLLQYGLDTLSPLLTHPTKDNDPTLPQTLKALD